MSTETREFPESRKFQEILRKSREKLRNKIFHFQLQPLGKMKRRRNKWQSVTRLRVSISLHDIYRSSLSLNALLFRSEISHNPAFFPRWHKIPPRQNEMNTLREIVKFRPIRWDYSPGGWSFTRWKRASSSRLVARAMTATPAKTDRQINERLNEN